MNLLFAVLSFTLLASDKICTKHLDRLLALHQEYGLPLPPSEAKLVQFVSFAGQVGYNAERATRTVDPGRPCLGFSLDGRTVLDNFNRAWRVDLIQPTKSNQTALDKNNEQAGLLLAIQCHARGWATLSHAVYRRMDLDWTWGENDLVMIAWDYWLSRLSYDCTAPLPVVAKYLKRLLPHLVFDKWADTEFGIEEIRALDRALMRRHSRPGSDEALIDDLINLMWDLDSEHKIQQPRSYPHYQNVLRASTKYQAMLRRGFAGVPALINHLDDERLTRVVRHDHVPLNVWSTYHCRVKDIAWNLLCAMADVQLADRKADTPTRVEAARKWFAEAQKIGEAEYIVTRVLGRGDEVGFDDQLFWLLCNKYPKRLPEIYRKLLDHAKQDHLAGYSWRFAKAVSEGPLPVADKRKILEYAAQQSESLHRAAGVKFLRPIDPKLAHESLIAGLAKLSGRITDGGMVLAEVAAESDDPRQWQALAKMVRCADVGSRLELLKMIAEEPSHANRTVRLKFLAEYMTDDAVRDQSDDDERYKFAQFIAGGDFDRLEVRDFAAWELARLLKLDAVARVDWAATDWAAFRTKVRVAVAKELGH